ncbi:MAG: polyprenyl synthetase family protein [Dehalococcoidia bacterium]
MTSSAIREALATLESTSNWDAYRDAYQELSSLLLDGMLPEWQRSVFTAVEVPNETLEILTQYAKGGKKMRGAMVLLGYQCAGGTDLESVMRSSVAYELIHSAFLIHDDIMDRSKTRRNLETAHVAFSKLGRMVGAEDPEQFGVSMAINTGDIAPAIAYNVVCSEPIEPQRVIAGMVHLNTVIINTVLGQFLDVATFVDQIPDEEDILKIHELKTAIYTVSGALQFGAVLAGAKETADGRATFDALARFGIPVGIAFQIQDDYLGMFSTEDELGKSVTSDLEERKNTLLFLQTLATGTDEQADILRDALGRHDLESAYVERVKAAIRDSGAGEYSAMKARELVAVGRDEVDDVTGDERLRTLLGALAEFVISRGF